MNTGGHEVANPASPEPKEPIGTAGKVLRAFAFAGGGFDTAMQLGVAHAMVVSQRQAPDVVAGISVGAMNAATLAEVLQAGHGLEGECLRDAQVTRLRKFLHEYREAPGALLSAILPDGYEVNFSQALRPIRLPIHQEEERRKRAEAARTRSGVIHLFNGILRLDVSVRTLTEILRCVLGLMQSAEIRDGAERERVRWRLIKALWRRGCWNLHNVAQQVCMMLWRIGQHRWFPERGQKAAEGVEAHQIIFGRLKRRIIFLTVWLIGYPLLVICWGMLGITLLLLSALWNFGARRLVKWWWAGRPKGDNSWLTEILKTYGIDKGLGDSHFLRRFFIRLFDPAYYGTPTSATMKEIVESALKHNYATGEGPMLESQEPKSKPLSAYSDARKISPPIHVAPMAASIRRGELEALDESTPVVDALMAATAVAPLFPPVTVGQDRFIDGWNISNEPTLGLLQLLRERIHPEVKGVEIYPVTPFPISQLSLPSKKPHFTSLVEVVFRAIQLRRYRDATLERRIVGLYQDVMPADKPVLKISEKIGDKTVEKTFINASVHPIELSEALESNERILGSSDEYERRRMIEEAVADGCRATLEAMMQGDIQRAAESVAKGGTRPSGISCRAMLREDALPGAAPEGGPGIPELCKVCCAARKSKDPAHERMLTVKPPRADWPAWPRKDAPETSESTPATSGADATEESGSRGTPHQQRMTSGEPAGAATKDESKWPVREPGDERPTVTCLFSGGVFRGVFQVGVLNALNELGLKPDMMAGSSVGSIIAALGAEVFVHKGRDKRALQMARLGATFLSLDRLILTDRLSDFVRRLTLRAAETGFSPLDADIVFRRYDVPRGMRYERCLRRVVAGLERLLYVSPYELNSLVKASRLRRRKEINRALRAYVKEFLERYEVGQELLGSEPLRMLINTHILDVHPGLPAVGPDALPFKLFEEHGIRLLATTTNLRSGSLDVIGGSHSAFLVDGLLASSAFPGVFRPRYSWELGRGSSEECPFIDGGVMDNLPLAAVVGELAAVSAIKSRPRIQGIGPVPHLILAASLEVNVEQLSEEAAARVVSWPEVWKRATRLNYNRKLRIFEETYEDLRRLHEHYQEEIKKGAPDLEELDGRRPPLDIQVLSIKPEWLCKTFAMHPMLGFRRSKQAASIAHGCAATLARFARLKAEHPEWAAGWGIEATFDPDAIRKNESTSEWVLHPQGDGKGKCWFRDAPCPFSQTHLETTTNGELGVQTLKELDNIYRLCGERRTHRPLS